MSSPASTAPRILCVDDRVASLEVRRALLTQVGYSVLIASDPAAALAIVDKVNVDLVVLDYSFPGQMNGEELAHRLKVKKPGMPLIMLSGYPDLPASARESVDALIAKGAGGPSELLNMIAKLLPSAPPQRAPTPVARDTETLRTESGELLKRVQQDRAAREKMR